MKISLKTALSKLNKMIKSSAVLRTALTVLACAVVFAVTYVMIIPAVTMEYKANDSEFTISSAEATLLGSSADGIVEYSSDLSNFVTGLTVSDLDGTPLDTDDTVVLNEDYYLTINFSESEYMQMAVTGGVMTYQLPDAIDAPTASDKIYVNGVAIGEYSISSDGLLTITPYNVDTSGNTTDALFIDNYQNTSISISFTAEVSNNDGPGAVSIDLGNDVTVDLEVINNGQISTTKEFLSADYANKVINYRFTVTAGATDVNGVVIRDKANQAQRFSSSAMKIYDNDGNDVTSQFTFVTPTTSSTVSSDYTLPEGFAPAACNNLPTSGKQIEFFVYGSTVDQATTEMYAYIDTIEAGETYTFEYSLPMSDYAMSSGTTLWLNNSVTATGTNTDGNTVTSTSSDGDHVDFNFIDKTGVDMATTDSEDHRVFWTVTIDYKGQSLSGRTFMDMPFTMGTSTGTLVIDTESVDIDKTVPISVTYWDADGNQGTTTVSWDSIPSYPFPAEGLTLNAYMLTTPFDDENAVKYVLQYYTTYDVSKGGADSYNMIMDGSDDGMNPTAGGTVRSTTVDPTVTKSGYITSDAEHIHFDIKVDVPAGINQYSNFYLSDYIMFQKGGAAERTWYGQEAWENITVSVTDSDGNPVEMPEYTSGDADGTYMIDVDEENDYRVFFNSTTEEGSVWKEDYDCIITVSYDIPVDFNLIRFVTSSSTPIQNTAYTSSYLLENGVPAVNRIYVEYGTHSVKADASVLPSTTKTGTMGEDGTADYEVEFDPGSSSIPLADGKISVTDFAFVDEYDEQLSYNSGSLKIKVKDVDDSNYATFTYTGSSSAFDTNHKIVASASDFVLDTSETTNSMSSAGLTTLAQFLSGYIDPSDVTFVASYTMSVTDEAKAQPATSLTIENTGYFQWNGGTTNKPSETLTYETDLMSKTFAQRGDLLDYTILLNPGKIDLLEDNDTITIQDTMSDNLSVYWTSIKVYYYDDAADDWVEINDTSTPYTCTKSFDSDNNMLIFNVPDSQYLKFTYTTLITEVGNVSVSNAVSLVGYGEAVKVSRATFAVSKSGGTASAGYLGFTLSKSDNNNNMLEGAAFALYTEVQNPENGDENPYSADSTITVTGNDDESLTLYYYKTYTTGEDGTSYIQSQYLYDNHVYAVSEVHAPTGYAALTSPVVFNMNPNGEVRELSIPTVETILQIKDESLGYTLPSTGGIGTYVFFIAGALLLMTGTAIVIKRKRMIPGEVTHD